jgi:hypothetical protein
MGRREGTGEEESAAHKDKGTRGRWKVGVEGTKWLPRTPRVGLDELVSEGPKITNVSVGSR